jgi:hypothetical protein
MPMSVAMPLVLQLDHASRAEHALASIVRDMHIDLAVFGRPS